MEHTRIRFDLENEIGPVDPRIFGGFLEHIGRAVYEGIYDPTSSHADEDGFRKDVLSALKKLDMTIQRYPGGNFASGYHWQDGIGPIEKRPVRRDLAWQSIEPNSFGTDEFIRLCRKLNWMPMLTVNLGTGTPEEACNWVEYCNMPAGSYYADLRVSNGYQQPHFVKLWCVGNELDGPWQLGHVNAEEYGIRAQQAAKMMKDVDSSIEVVVCGSSYPAMPTYIEWDRQVLEAVGDLADYISLHRYVGNPEGDTPNFLAITNAIDQQIEEIDSVCKYVQAKQRSRKRTFLCFDEWNVWYKNTEMNGAGKHAPHLNEEMYNFEDTLVVAGFLQSFIRHADVVKVANLAQIVNVLAPIHTQGDEMLIQSIFYPFEMISRRKTGVSLHPFVVGPKYESKKNGEVTYIDCAAILNDKTLHVFITNRMPDEPAPVTINLTAGKIKSLDSAEILSDQDPKIANSYEHPDLIKSRPFQEVNIVDGTAQMKLPRLSFAALSFTLD